MYTRENSIIIDDTKDFEIQHILECGQIFRFKRMSEDCWEVFSKDKRCVVQQKDGQATITCSDIDYFINYFDLKSDYCQIKQRLAKLPFMSDAIEFGRGIRILRQDKWEMLISFIISANNHIPRIKAIIERLCARLGEEMDGYFAFPSAKAMAEKDVDFYREIGAGYRAEYLLATARAVNDGFDLERVSQMNGMDGNKELCKLLGVGPKVADCVLLFGYHKIDVFPVDTWIKKVYKDIIKDDCANNKTIRTKLLELYGKDAGYAQQYLFFNKRES